MRIYFLRHAHAGWALPGVRDFDRTLDVEGREEAARMSASFRLNGYEVAKILCSNASRCRETLEILLRTTGQSAMVEYSDGLYTGSYESYLDLIAEEQARGTPSLMLVGHNPMLEDAAQALLQKNPSMADEALGRGFPTAGLLVMEIEPGFKAASADHARLVGMISPLDA